MSILTVIKNNWSQIEKDIYQFLLGALGALCVLFIYHALEGHQQPRIATVNLTGVVNNFIKAQVGQQLSQEEQQRRVKAFGSSLEKTMKEIALKHHVVLMPSEAVIAGARDYTPVLQQRLTSLQ